MADRFAVRSMKRKNKLGLEISAAPKPPPTAETANLGPMLGGAKGDGETAQLEIGIEYNLDLRPEDLDFIKELGSGNGGTVSKVRHVPTNTIMARKVGVPRSLPLNPPLSPNSFKVIHVEAKREMRKRIVRELQIMHSCHSDYIVTFYGAFLNENNDVIMCMEYMDVG